MHTAPQNNNSASSKFTNATAVILAGGLGTRLRSVVSDRPKVLAPVLGRPFLAYLLDQVHAAGFERVVLCTGYKAEMLSETFGDEYAGMRLLYSPEPQPLGTGGALRLCADLLPAGRYSLVMNGDSYCDVDFAEFGAWHRQGGFGASLVLSPVPDVSRYGQVLTRDDGQVLAFEEKRPGGGAGWINSGLYYIPNDWVQEIPAGTPVSFERDVLPRWIQRSFGGYRSPGAFLDIGTPESYGQTEAFFRPLDRQRPAA